MNANECANLLKVIVSIDGRNLTKLSVGAWTPLLADVPYAAALDAVEEWYRTTDRYVMPANIIDAVRQRQKSLPPAYYPPQITAGERGMNADPEHVAALVGELRKKLPPGYRKRSRAAASEARGHLLTPEEIAAGRAEIESAQRELAARAAGASS